MPEAWKQWEGETVNSELRLGQYLGCSGHSAVFLAQFTDQDRQPAAIKLIAEDSPNAESRFEQWQFAATLSHANLIRIFQTGRCQIGDAKLLFLLMEYADENLSHIVPYRPLAENEAGAMLTSSLDALAFLHAKGLVHGRLKPTNIMASGDLLKLSSDGIRRAGDSISDQSVYDPPEAVSSPASDVWSLGITLVEVLTQHPPSWDRSSTQDPRVPQNLPPTLLEVVRHCLRRAPAARWTIANIGNRLKSPQAGHWAPPVVQRKDKPANSHYLIGAVILFLASVGFLSLKLMNHAPRQDALRSPVAEKRPAAAEPQPAKPQPAKSEPGKPEVAKSEPAKPEPVKPEPAKPEPVKPAPKQAASAVPPETKPAPTREKPGVDSGSQPAAPAAPSRPAQQSKPVPDALPSDSGVIRQSLPDAPQKSLATIRGTVRVGIKVSVGPSGTVTGAEIDSRGPSTYFADLALQAARKWQFAPASDDSREWILSFEFSNDGAKASAKKSAP